MTANGYKHVTYSIGKVWVEGGLYSEEELLEKLNFFKKREEALAESMKRQYGEVLPHVKINPYKVG